MEVLEEKKKVGLTQRTSSDEFEDLAAQDGFGDFAELDENEQTNDDKPVVHARIRLVAVIVAKA